MVGDNFQQGTKYFRGRLLGGSLDWSNKPYLYKNYQSAKRIALPPAVSDSSFPLIEIIKKRKSIRSYSSKPLRLVDLSFLLWACTGIQRSENGYDFRTIPSAGALYPIETYIVVNNVEDLPKGLYHYDIKEHSLEELRIGSIGERLSYSALEQNMCAKAPVVFIWTAIFERSKWKYGQRAYRYVYLDAGHIAQNLTLAATSFGLGSCQIGAFFDDEINQIIDIDGYEESVLYLSVVGHPK